MLRRKEVLKLSTWSKGVSGGFEALLAIPIIGGTWILLSGYQLIWIAFLLHLITLGISIAKKTSFLPSIVGIITCMVAIVPVVGWFFHAVTAVLLLISAMKDKKTESQ